MLHAIVQFTARGGRFDEESEVEPGGELLVARALEIDLEVGRAQDGRRGLVPAREYGVEPKTEVALVEMLAHRVITRGEMQMSHFRAHEVFVPNRESVSSGFSHQGCALAFRQSWSVAAAPTGNRSTARVPPPSRGWSSTAPPCRFAIE